VKLCISPCAVPKLPTSAFSSWNHFKLVNIPIDCRRSAAKKDNWVMLSQIQKDQIGGSYHEHVQRRLPGGFVILVTERLLGAKKFIR
jgi:hypothetical protein